ncbi:MAG: hypothetical protein ACTSWN_07280, partial [Promethearchaeota archaeon]
LSKLIGYVGLYCDLNKLNLLDMTDVVVAWYVVVKCPDFLSSHVDSGRFQPVAGYPGLYEGVDHFPCRFYILVINKLMVVGENLLLLLSSTGETLRKTIQFILDNKDQHADIVKKYINTLYFLRHDEVKGMTEIENLIDPHVKENIKNAINDLGIKLVIDAIGLEAIKDAVDLKDLVSIVDLEELLKVVDLKELLKVVDLKELLKVVDLKELAKVVDLKELLKAVGVDKIESIIRELKENGG